MRRLFLILICLFFLTSCTFKRGLRRIIANAPEALTAVQNTVQASAAVWAAERDLARQNCDTGLYSENACRKLRRMDEKARMLRTVAMQEVAMEAEVVRALKAQTKLFAYHYRLAKRSGAPE